jgi:hypothetical protein
MIKLDDLLSALSGGGVEEVWITRPEPGLVSCDGKGRTRITILVGRGLGDKLAKAYGDPRDGTISQSTSIRDSGPQAPLVSDSQPGPVSHPLETGIQQTGNGSEGLGSVPKPLQAGIQRTGSGSDGSTMLTCSSCGAKVACSSCSGKLDGHRSTSSPSEPSEPPRGERSSGGQKTPDGMSALGLASSKTTGSTPITTDPTQPNLMTLSRRLYMFSIDHEQIVQCIKKVDTIKFARKEKEEHCVSQPIFVHSRSFIIVIRKEAGLFPAITGGTSIALACLPEIADHG